MDAATAYRLAAGATAAPINITFNEHFLCQSRTFLADIAGAVQTDSSRVLPLCTVEMSELGAAGGAFQTGAVPLSSLFGSGDKPYVLPVPKFFKAKTTLSLSVVNYSAATAYANIRFVFHGVQLFAR